MLSKLLVISLVARQKNRRSPVFLCLHIVDKMINGVESGPLLLGCQ